MCRAVSSRRVLYRRCPKRSGATATSSHRTAVTPCWLAFGRRRRGSSHMKWLARRPSPPADAAKPTTAGTSLSLVVRKRHAVFHEGQGVGYLIGVYRGSIRSQRVGQTLEVVAFEEARSCRRIREAQDQRGVEPLTRGLSCATFGVSQSFSIQGRNIWALSSFSAPVPARALVSSAMCFRKSPARTPFRRRR